MIKKYKPEPTDAEVKKRLKEFGRKHRDKYPVAPVNENKREGLLAGAPDKIKHVLMKTSRIIMAKIHTISRH